MDVLSSQPMPLTQPASENVLTDGASKEPLRALSEPSNSQFSPIESSFQARAEYRESMAINLVTQDGDRVQVRFFASEQASYSDTAEGLSLGYSSQSRFQFEVKGELDSEELDAINDLLDSVSDIADQFYAGRVDQAFEQATALEMDPSQLARLDLNLQMSARVELRDYRAISEEAYPERSIAQQIQNWLKPLEFLQQQPILEQINNSDLSLLDLMKGSLDVRGDQRGIPFGLESLLSELL